MHHLNLTQVPFSRAGSYLAFSQRDPADALPWEQRPGETLFLRTVRGDREDDRVFRVDLLVPNGSETVPARVEAQPHLLRLHAEGGRVDICLPAPGVVRVRGTGEVGLRLTLTKINGYSNAQPYDTEGRWLVNAWTARMTYLLLPLVGKLVMDAPFWPPHTAHVIADFLPNGAEFEAIIEEFLTERRPARPMTTFEQDADAAATEFETFRAGLPPVSEALQPAADLMAYVQWSALVAPEGHFQRPAMLMSKNHMTQVWSWDHCFNALALMPHAPEMAWDQFCLPFDYQDSAGALPDSVSDKGIVRNFTKPPIHGWTLRGLLERDRTRFLTTERCGAIYEPLARWTRWWLTCRDQDGDGVPQYNHGNDSGWDNSTSFDVGFPLEGPDLSAYLILQMDILAGLAGRLGKPGEAAQWTLEADALLGRLMAHSWRGPVWAPPVLLIADGLRRMGETNAARTIAARFCRAVSHSGSAENFNALTGAGLRDRAYTWTASVFLILAQDYLTQR